jgi:hypothetical protein
MIRYIARKLGRPLPKRRREKKRGIDTLLTADDVFLVSYPRSGNTLLRVIIANMFYGPGCLEGLADLNRLVPDIYWGIPEHNEYSTPRFIKTHQPFAWRHGAERTELYRRAIYIARNPIDAIRSYWDYSTRTHEDFDLSLEEFGEQVVNGARFPGSWNEHVLSWTTLKDREVLVIKYEDLTSDFGPEARRIAGFLGREMNEDELRRIEAASDIKTMKALEQSKPLLEGNREHVRGTEAPRSIEQTMSAGLRQLIVSRCAEAMEALGYEAAPEKAGDAAKTRTLHG